VANDHGKHVDVVCFLGACVGYGEHELSRSSTLFKSMLPIKNCPIFGVACGYAQTLLIADTSTKVGIMPFKSTVRPICVLASVLFGFTAVFMWLICNTSLSSLAARSFVPPWLDTWHSRKGAFG
jgi:hypothetical protein